MSTPRITCVSTARALLLGTAIMAANLGCGRSGTGLGPGADASLAAGGSGGDNGGAGGSSGPGGTMDAGIGQGGASSSAIGGSASGAKSSGGSTSSATVVKTREPQIHRSQALSCVGVFAPSEPTGQSGSCKKHADCNQRKGGFCVLPDAGYGRAAGNYYCVYEGCAADADCGTDKVCFCSPNNVPRCSYAGNCRTDADCGGGAYGYCSPSNGYDCTGIYRSYSGHYCHTPKDTCIDDSDCTGKNTCDYDPIDGRWECKPVNVTCAIG